MGGLRDPSLDVSVRRKDMERELKRDTYNAGARQSGGVCLTGLVFKYFVG